MTGAPRKPQTLPDLPLSRSTLDRTGWRRSEPGLLERLWSDPATKVVELRGDRLPVRPDGSGLVACAPGGLAPGPGDVLVYLGEGEEGSSWVGVVRGDEALGEAEQDDGPVRWRGLRSLGLTLGHLDVALAAALVGMGHWHRSHGFCARCGRPTEAVQAGWVRRCPAGHDGFPVTSPAVIMAVTDPDDRLLLARNASWPPGRMSVLAGFVEPGESLEAAVQREVAEEVGILVEDVTYAGNQPWPFPASLMLAFTARATQTRLAPVDGEIAEARWFTRDEAARAIASGTVLSGGSPVSVAYHLIESWLGSPIAGHLRPVGP